MPRPRQNRPATTFTCGHGHVHKSLDDALYCNRDLPLTEEQAIALGRTCSPTQMDILRHLITGDEPMAYFKGGFWSLPSIGQDTDPTSNRSWEGHWYVQIQSLMALERSGILGRLETATNYDATRYPGLRDFVLTERGLLVARLLTGETP